MKCELSLICGYVNETIATSELSKFNYISTENMLPNKNGIEPASSLPNQKVVKAFKKGDILISNIRPYFKKIWLAEYNGGCSNDVLVIRAKKGTNKEFLYYLLSENKFFDYVTASSKGTKMPRGDKNAIMNYLVPEFEEKEQRKIAKLLGTIDKKIKVNKKINDNLEKQAKTIFEKCFPDINNGSDIIGKVIVPKRGKTLLSKNALLGDIPVIAGGIEPTIYHNIANTIPPVITISASGANAGYVNLWNRPVWSSDSSFIDLSMTKNVYFWYILLKNKQKEIFESQTGSAQPHIYPKHIAELKVNIPSKKSIQEFSLIITPFFEHISKNLFENDKLSNIRNAILPKLISGNIDISNI